MTVALTALPARSRDLSGIMLAAAAFAFSTAADTIFKLLAAGHAPWQILAGSGVFALMVVIGRAHVTGGVAQLATTRPLLHLIRACAGAMSTLMAIYAYARLPLTDFYAIVFAGPLLVTLLSSLWLGEKVDRARWLAIMAGFGGIVVVANPLQSSGGISKDAAMIGHAAAFASVFCYAVSVIMVRRMRGGESSMTFSLFGYSIAVVAGLALCVLAGAAPLSGQDVALLMLSGAVGGTGTLCLMEAYHRAPVAMVAPFQYTQIFWGAVAGFLLWREMPSAALTSGTSIVIASGLFILYRDLRGRS